MASSTAKERSLSGKYSLNKKTSDPISPFLKIAGYSWATRKAADAVGLTLTIEQTSESLSGHGSTWLGDGTYRLSFVEKSKYALIGDDCIEFESSLLDDGSVKSTGVMPNDSKLRVVMLHCCGEDGGLVVTTSVSDAQGQHLLRIERYLDAVV